MKVDQNNKTIQLVDLKTCSVPAWQFSQNFIKYRYDIQAALHTDVVQKIISALPEYKDYKILPYIFASISKTDKVPVSYIYNPRAESQICGLTYTQNNKTYMYKSWQDLLIEILDYKDANAKVPSYIMTEQPNDLITLLNN
jgi:hypothetical protein